jgi:hypothetical protein
VEWNPPDLSRLIRQLEHAALAFRKRHLLQPDAMKRGLKPIQVPDLEVALPEFRVVPDARQELVDRDHRRRF